MGIIIVDEYEGDVSILHSAPNEVRQEPLMEFAMGYSWVSGFKFLRLPDDARYRAVRKRAGWSHRSSCPPLEQ